VRILHAVAATLVVTVSSVATAQSAKEPRRPKLAAGADTNDAHAYYAFAMDVLTDKPGQAADALYWATRLDPMSADAFYARRVALLLENPDRLLGYSSGDSKAIAEARSIDSLQYRALTINPFLARCLDKNVVQAEMDNIARRNGGRSVLLELIANRLPLTVRAALSYCDGFKDQALKLYGQAIDRNKTSPAPHIDRARVYFNMNQPDSALADLKAALDLIHTSEKKDVVFVYQSRALVEHSLAIVYQRLGNAAAAKEAFGRALQEDLSYYPAHLELAFMAIEARDTTTGLAELDLATQLRGDDPGAQYLHAYALVMAGRVAEADPHLKRAIELDPVYAAPRFLRARLLELADFGDEAIAAYKEFLAGAARNDLRRAEAEAHLASLTKPPRGVFH
jgi:tetratricopeptide (TPR) repeat protein